MKSEKFNSSEIEIIVSALKTRVENNELNFDLNNGDFQRNKLNYESDNELIKPLILKIEQEPVFKFTGKEIHIVISVTNQSLSKLEKDKEIDYNNPLFWLNLSIQQKETLNLIDLHKDILGKTGFYKKEKFIPIESLKFRYRHIFERIEKLQKSETIFLSRLNNFYKIGFLYNKKELALFELGYQINLFKNPFNLMNETINEIENQFSIETNKLTAKKIFSNIKPSDYPEYVIEFFLKILES